MQKDIAEARSSIEYLKKQIDETSLAGLQNVIFNLIEDQTRIMVLAETSDEYFFKTIDPAVRPEEKYRPFRTLIVLVAAFLAGVLAVFWVILRHSYAATNKAS